LTYINNYTVSPTTTYSVTVGTGGTSPGSPCSSGANGAVRIIWPGNTRSFPSTSAGNP
jgi:hypothetical protein